MLQEFNYINNEKETHVIPSLKQAYADEKITFGECDKEMKKLTKVLSDIIEKVKSMKTGMDKQNKKIGDISVQVTIRDQETKETLDCMEKDAKLGMKEALNTRCIANNNQYEIGNLKRTVESHVLKLNSMSKMGGAWRLHSDHDKYPILKNEKFNHWSKYNDNLKDIVFKVDNLIDL